MRYCIDAFPGKRIVVRMMMTALVLLLQGTAPKLEIRGDGVHAMTLGAAELGKLPHHAVSAKGHHDSTATSYSGILLDDVLKLAGIGADSRKRTRSTMYVVVEAADGYRMLFSLAELDPTLSDKQVLLVDSANGKPLSDAQGPLRLVVPDEKREARWVRQVRAIVVHRAP